MKTRVKKGRRREGRRLTMADSVPKKGYRIFP
jgi:hypothetical protein